MLFLNLDIASIWLRILLLNDSLQSRYLGKKWIYSVYIHPIKTKLSLNLKHISSCINVPNNKIKSHSGMRLGTLPLGHEGSQQHLFLTSERVETTFFSETTDRERDNL